MALLIQCRTEARGVILLRDLPRNPLRREERPRADRRAAPRFPPGCEHERIRPAKLFKAAGRKNHVCLLRRPDAFRNQHRKPPSSASRSACTR